MSITLSQYLIHEYAEKSNSKTAKAWRTGNNEGIKHPKITQSMIDEIGMKNILEQAKELESKHIITGHWRNMNTDLTSIDFPMSNLDKLYVLEHLPNLKDTIRTQATLITKRKASTDKEWLIQYDSNYRNQQTKGTIDYVLHNDTFDHCRPIYRKAWHYFSRSHTLSFGLYQSGLRSRRR